DAVAGDRFEGPPDRQVEVIQRRRLRLAGRGEGSRRRGEDCQAPLAAAEKMAHDGAAFLRRKVSVEEPHNQGRRRMITQALPPLPRYDIGTTNFRTEAAAPPDLFRPAGHQSLTVGVYVPTNIATRSCIARRAGSSGRCRGAGGVDVPAELLQEVDHPVREERRDRGSDWTGAGAGVGLRGREGENQRDGEAGEQGPDDSAGHHILLGRRSTGGRFGLGAHGRNVCRCHEGSLAGNRVSRWSVASESHSWYIPSPTQCQSETFRQGRVG